jgi:hypothetical protein
MYPPGGSALLRSVWGHLLVLALLSAASPATLLPVLVLLNLRGAGIVAAYALGSLCSTLVVTTVTVAGIGGANADQAHVSTARGGFELAAGLLLMLLGLLRWRDREARRQAASAEPSWLRVVQRLGLFTAFLFGAIWITTIFAVDAGLEIAGANVSDGQAALAIVLYTLGACAGPIVVLALYVLNRERAEERLARSQAWLIANSGAAVALVLVGLGAILAVKGAAGLS